MNAALGKPDLLTFWFGESDEVTHPAVIDAARQSLQAGETFYTANLGLPTLRDSVAAYMARLHGSDANPIGANRIAITSGGVSGLMLATQGLVNAGDEVVCITPRALIKILLTFMHTRNLLAELFQQVKSILACSSEPIQTQFGITKYIILTRRLSWKK